MADHSDYAVDLMEFMWADYMLDNPRMTNSTFTQGFPTDGTLTLLSLQLRSSRQSRPRLFYGADINAHNLWWWSDDDFSCGADLEDRPSTGRSQDCSNKFRHTTWVLYGKLGEHHMRLLGNFCHTRHNYRRVKYSISQWFNKYDSQGTGRSSGGPARRFVSRGCNRSARR